MLDWGVGPATEGGGGGGGRTIGGIEDRSDREEW